MVTDSFHGTAFAINFNTQFIEVLPNTKPEAGIRVSYISQIYKIVLLQISMISR